MTEATVEVPGPGRLQRAFEKVSVYVTMASQPVVTAIVMALAQRAGLPGGE